MRGFYLQKALVNQRYSDLHHNVINTLIYAYEIRLSRLAHSRCYSFFFFFKQKTAYEIAQCLVGSEMCIRDSGTTRVSNPA